MEFLSREVIGCMEKSSWIRRMFEVGMELKNKVGAENVFDFSLGNPDLSPPPELGSTLKELSGKVARPGGLGYMPNAGYPKVRRRLAEYLSDQQEKELTADHVIMTCGAAGGLNVFFRACLEPGDEVICPAPFFAEYVFYVSNFKGRFCPVRSKPLTFELDIAAMDRAITEKTRVVMINSPNNPSGVIYTRDEMTQLAALLRKHSAHREKPIMLVSDEPYRFLNYDNVEIPALMSLYTYTVVVGSFSKSLSMAGERTGYIAVNPDIEDVKQLVNGLIMTNRILGFVNSPAIGQQLVSACLHHHVDMSVYRERRDAMAAILTECGIRFTMPKGAFYFFPESPLEDDKEFIRALMKENILAVPGAGFGYPGYFRLAYCVDLDVIKRSAPAFRKAMRSLRV